MVRAEGLTLTLKDDMGVEKEFDLRNMTQADYDEL